MNRIAALPALLLSLSPLTLACGNSDTQDAEAPASSASSAATTATALTKAEFTTKANAICAKATGEVTAAIKAASDDPSDEEVAQVAHDVLVPSMQQQHDDIEALGAPEGDEDEVQAILGAMQDGVDAVRDDPATLKSADDPFQKASDLADAYGLDQCSSI